MSSVIRILAVGWVVVSAGPALALDWNDRPPPDDDPQPHATWSFDMMTEQPVPHDDETYAVAPPQDARGPSGPTFALIPLPIGDGSPGSEAGSLAPESGAPKGMTAKAPTPTAACSGNC